MNKKTFHLQFFNSPLLLCGKGGDMDSSHKIKKMMASLIGRKVKAVRERSQKTMKEVAQFLKMSEKEIEKFEQGSLDTTIGSSYLMKLFYFLEATKKDILFFQLLNKQTVEEMYSFYEKASDKEDFIDDFIKSLESLENSSPAESLNIEIIKKILSEKIDDPTKED